jgi:hypothetical protein
MNTNKRIDNTFLVAERGGHWVPVLDEEQVSIAGVTGRASPILLDFVDPSGARTGRLLPTGLPQQTVHVPLSSSRKAIFPVSLVDSTNPTVFTNDQSLRSALGIPDDAPIDYAAEPDIADALERVRQAGARLMGLDPLSQAQPKVAVLGRPPSPPSDDADDADITINAFSMGTLHRAVPMTVGLCLGVAACVPHTLAWDIVGDRRSDASEFLRIRHPSGVVQVGAELDSDGKVTSARVMRTGRRLMRGVVWW